MLLILAISLAIITASIIIYKYHTHPLALSRRLPLVALFAMLGKLAKADGGVTKEKIAIIDDFMDNQLQLNSANRALVIKAFNQAKFSQFPFAVHAQHFVAHFKNNQPFQMAIIDLFLQIASTNQKFHHLEEQMILSAVQIFAIDLDQYNQIKEHYFPEIQKYYAILQCHPQDSIAKIKTKYHHLMTKYHPDRLQAADLPAALHELAHEKFTEIQHAYEMIKTERGLK